MRARTIRAALALLSLGLAAFALAAGCSRNLPTAALVPTGVRTGVPPGGFYGYVLYDSLTYAGLTGTPYPFTLTQLYTYHSDAASNGFMTPRAFVRQDTVSGAKRRYSFAALPPDTYLVIARSHAFSPVGFGPVIVTDRVRDVGDLFMHANTTDSLGLTVFVTGTMPGYSLDDAALFNTLLDQNSLGVWSYPNSFATPATIPAGTYRFKFVTDAPSSTAGHLIGWGGDSTQVLEAPVTGAQVRFGTTAATDLKVHFPTTGLYAFTFDERRLTFSIALVLPSPSKLVASAGRMPR